MERDKELREIFSKILNAPFQRREQYSYKDSERTTFTWEEIFNEIGKLQERSLVEKKSFFVPDDSPINIC